MPEKSIITHIITAIELNSILQEYMIMIADKAGSTKKTYLKALNEFSFFFSADKNFLFTKDDFLRYKRYLESRKKMKPVSVKTYFTAIRRFIDFLVKKEILKFNDAKLIKIPITKRIHSLNFLTKSQIERLIKSIDKNNVIGLRDIAIIKLISTTAANENEIIDLIYKDIRIIRRKNYIHFLKNNTGQLVQITDDVYNSIQDYIFARNNSSLNLTDTLFISHSNRSSNQSLSIRGIREMLKIRINYSGINSPKKAKFTPLALKQSGAIFLASTGLSEEFLNQRLGLKLFESVHRYYEYLEIYNQ